MRIKRLYTFLIESYIGTFLAAFLVCLFFVLMLFLWQRIDDLIGKGLDFSVLFKFFFYAVLSSVPMAMPMTILVSSLITFGNLGEKLELLAMKAAGISLFRIMRPFIVFVSLVSIGEVVYSNYAMPAIQTKLWTLLLSIKQKSPEVEIPEGVFYQGIDGYNIYVREKDPDTKLLRDIMIYDISKGFENAVVMAADSGRLKSASDKKSLLMSLYSGESFENLKNQVSNAKAVPYRRESFSKKDILIEFDANFDMLDESVMSNRYLGKDLKALTVDIDSMQAHADSIDEANRKLYNHHYFDRGLLSIKNLYYADSIKDYTVYSYQSLWDKMDPAQVQDRVNRAERQVKRMKMDQPFIYSAKEADIKRIFRYDIERHRKFTLAFACVIFFFIAAPLGAIIRKGGLGFPAVISVILFLVYYIIDNSGYKMAREVVWPVWQGIWLSSFVLFPLGIVLTYKAATDQVDSIDFSAIKNWVNKIVQFFKSKSRKQSSERDGSNNIPSSPQS